MFCCGSGNDVAPAGTTDVMLTMKSTETGVMKLDPMEESTIIENGGSAELSTAPAAGAPEVERSGDFDSPVSRTFLLKEGKLHFGPYHVKRTLGKGMQATVKLGVHAVTGEKVALKVIDTSVMSARALAQIRKEVFALRAVNTHPNILRLRECVDDAILATSAEDGSGRRGSTTCWVMVLDLAGGGEIFDLMLYTGPFAPALARTYFAQLVSALQACHRLGVYHRDIKPENILLDDKFQLKLADFGLSAVHQDGTDVCKTYCGTKSYMAPEVMQQQHYGGGKADAWSIGVVLFIMLAGSPPMRTADSSDWWYKALMLRRNDKFWEAHERVCPEFPREAKHLIDSLFKVDPTERLSVEEVAQHPWMKEEAVMTAAELYAEVSTRTAAMDRQKAAERQVELDKRKKQAAARARTGGVTPFTAGTQRSAAAPGAEGGGEGGGGGGGGVRVPPRLGRSSSSESGGGVAATGDLGFGFTQHNAMYLFDPDATTTLERLSALCEEMGAVVKTKVDEWKATAVWPWSNSGMESDGGARGDRAVVVFHFFSIASKTAAAAVSPTATAAAGDVAVGGAGAGVGRGEDGRVEEFVTFVQMERIAGDIFDVRGLTEQIKAKLGDLNVKGEGGGGGGAVGDTATTVGDTAAAAAAAAAAGGGTVTEETKALVDDKVDLL